MDLEFAAGEKLTLRIKVFILGNRVYKMIAVTPNKNKEDEETRHFLNSIMFEKNQG